MTGIDRLEMLQVGNDQAGAEMLIESARFDNLANRHENGTAPRAVSAFNLFQTPAPVGDMMIDLIPGEYFRPSYNPAILEPSAGLGRLYQSAVNRLPGARYTLIEQSPDCMKELYTLTDGRGVELKQADFLSIKPVYEGNASIIVKELPEAFYDIIIMNPPFKMRTDIKHILHARKFLFKNGILISLCYNGVKQNKILKPMCNTWEVLPAGSFKSEGTRAEIALLTMTI